MKLVNLVKKYKWIFLLLLIYLVLRLINLTLLPIFNDESIYLEWGWRETHVPGLLYYSLYDAKQPLLMWIFGIFQQILFNPLFAGRLVSIITGIFTMFGIYYFCKKYLNQKTAIISSFIYILVPIFSFYDRLALMESAIAACGIWAGILFVEFMKKHDIKNAILLGIVLGVGFFIKSSILIFAIVILLLSTFFLFKQKQKIKFTKDLLIVLITFISVIFLLIINPQFWSTFSSNSRYTFTFSELLHFPIGSWILNILGNLEITFYYLSPLVFITFILGAYIKIKQKHKEPLILLLFFGFAFLLETLLTRTPTDRYLISYLPFVCIYAGFFIYYILSKNKYIGIALMLIVLMSSGIFTLLQIINPPLYIQSMAKLTKYSQEGYLKGVNSGYGIDETVSFIKQIPTSNLFIGVAENTGNPESAMFVYFVKNKQFNVAYFDARLLRVDLSSYDCLDLGVPFVFIARDNQQGGLEKFLEKIKTIKNPYDGSYSIGIFQAKKDCKGKYLKLVTQRNI